MSLKEQHAKLAALHGQVSDWLKGDGRYFMPSAVLDLFTRYQNTKQRLLKLQPTLFDDLPDRLVPTPSKTSDFGGQGYIERHHLDMLRQDLKYCLDALEHSEQPTPAPPTKRSEKGDGHGSQKTLLESYIDKFKNHRVISIIIVAAVVVIAVGTFTDGISKIRAFLATVLTSQVPVEGPLELELRVENKSSSTRTLVPYIEFYITEDRGFTIDQYAKGREYLTPLDEDNFTVAPSETRRFTVRIPE